MVSGISHDVRTTDLGHESDGDGNHWQTCEILASLGYAGGMRTARVYPTVDSYLHCRSNSRPLLPSHVYLSLHKSLVWLVWPSHKI